MLWKGFEHRWRREILGFQTPHRISKLANSVHDVHHDTSAEGWAPAFRAEIAFAPGLAGDVAFPQTYFGGVWHPELAVGHGRVDFEMSDRVRPGEAPVAHSHIDEQIILDLDRPELAAGQLDQYAVVLRGFALDTDCNPAEQPDGASCNSDGMWAHRVYLGIDQCERAGAELRCRLRADIRRGWTPTRGGFVMSLNQRMDISGTLHFTILGGDRPHFAARRGQRSVERDSIRGDGASGRAALAGRKGLAHATVGLAGFGYELLPDAPDDHPGRYMESLHVGVADNSYDPKTGELTYRYRAGFRVPVTVFDSRVRYTIEPVLLQLGRGAKVLEEQGVHRPICFSGMAFDCDDGGFVEQTSDSATIGLSKPR